MLGLSELCAKKRTWPRCGAGKSWYEGESSHQRAQIEATSFEVVILFAELTVCVRGLWQTYQWAEK
jgi:hypothetical protein